MIYKSFGSLPAYGESSIVLLSNVHAMKLRGGNSTSSSLRAEAITFFTSERTPAALVAGMALSMLFSMPLKQDEGHLRSFAKRVYVALSCSSLCHEMVSVFASSLAIVQILKERRDFAADCPMTMMMQEYPLYFLAVRTHFISGLLCFVGSIAVRMWIEYSSGCNKFAKAMTYLLGATMVFMLSLFNTSLLCSESLGSMWVKYATAMVRATKHRVGPNIFLAVLLGVMCLKEMAACMGLAGRQMWQEGT